MKRAVAASLSVAILASGCASGGTAGGGGSVLEPRLDGRTFLSTAVSENGAPRPLFEDSRIRLRFEAGRLSADAGCNHLSGGYRLEGTTLVVGQLAMTEMACMPEERMAQDTWLADLLVSQPTVTLSGDTLRVTGRTSEVQLLDREVADPDRALVGPRWQVESIVSGDAVSSIPGDAEAHLTFAADERVSGNTGCNEFSAATTRRPTRSRSVRSA
jgi:heat shock protein HslJ